MYVYYEFRFRDNFWVKIRYIRAKKVVKGGKMSVNFLPHSLFKISSHGIVKLVVGSLFVGSSVCCAAPSGGVVTLGDASISKNGANTQILQKSQKTSINWSSFGAAKGESIEFWQPNKDAIALNRVIGGEKSVIDGLLKANGQVWILNSNGVLFGKTASVNTAGLIASTLNMTDKNFLNGEYRFESSGSGFGVVNMGSVDISDAGYAAFLANNVSNDGVIGAIKGKATLIGADEVLVNIAGNSLIGFTISKGAFDSLAQNRGAIYVNGGEAYLTTAATDGVLSGVVNNSGVVEAKTVGDLLGKINLSSNIVVNNGSLDASGQTGGTVTSNASLIIDAGKTNVEGVNKGGSIVQVAGEIMQSKSATLNASSKSSKGGLISLSSNPKNDSSQLYLSGSMNASGKDGGEIRASSNTLTLAGAKIDASGENSAGSVKLGGGWQGKDESVANASRAIVDKQTTISALVLARTHS